MFATVIVFIEGGIMRRQLDTAESLADFCIYWYGRYIPFSVIYPEGTILHSGI